MPALVNYSSEPRAVELREVPVPEIGEDDVLLAVESVSICGSDLHQWLGQNGWHVNYPCTLGHEFAGTVEQVGRRVRNFHEGDRVTSETAAVIDESSPYSRRGLYNLDPHRLGFGYGVDGAMTQYVRVPERCLHAVPDHLYFDQAALTEPCCVAYNAVCVQTDIRPGDHVLVLGPGPIGLLCAMMAKLSGAGHLIVAGLPSDKHRLETARQIGADATLDGDVDEYVRNLEDGFGVDVVIDAAGGLGDARTRTPGSTPSRSDYESRLGPTAPWLQPGPARSEGRTRTGKFLGTTGRSGSGSSRCSRPVKSVSTRS